MTVGLLLSDRIVRQVICQHLSLYISSLQCFDAVGCAAGRASGLF